MKRPSIALPFGALVVAFALVASTGCSDDSTDSTDSNADSKVLTIYTGRNVELIEPLVETFEKESGIDVELRAGGSAELAAQIITEGAASPADLFFSQDAGALGAVTKKGLFAELDSSILDLVPAAYRAQDGSWVGVSGRSRVIVYNPDLVPDPPTEIDGLLDPKWKGQLGFAPTNASWQAFVTALRLVRGEAEAKTWLEKFIKNEPKAYENNAVVRDAVDAGDIALGPINHYYLYELINEVGADKVTAKNQFLGNGDVGGLVNVAGVAVLKTAPDAENATKFVDFLLSAEGQTYFAEKTFEYPLVDGIAPPAGVPSLDSLDPPEIDLSDLDSLEQTQELLSEVGLLTR